MNIETIISISAVFISLCAFGVAIWQGFITRTHNKLSVRPLLNFSTRFTEDEFVLKLENQGIGPAIISTFDIKFSSSKIGNNPHEIAVKLCEELDIIHLGCSINFPSKNHVLSAGDEYEIFKTSGFNNDNNVKERIYNDMLLLEIKIEYMSMYNEKFSVYRPVV
ncbi:MAG: hypothetical protein PVH88_11390 [Ignavibacteria bacterium]|jgi:hypothetical protein